jgi:HAD superfamily hydrolase (TIGR01509 family)
MWPSTPAPDLAQFGSGGKTTSFELMKRFKAIIFDMDGVIVDSEPRHEQAFREIFAEIGYGENHGIDFTSYYGRSDRALWVDFIEKHKPSFTLDYLLDYKQRRFLEIIKKDQPIFETLPELVEHLSRHYQLALASGSYHPVIDTVLAMRDLRRYFQAVVSVQDVQRGKPAPDVFLRAAELLQVSPADCCVIEDAAARVQAALAAGMTVIGITNSLPPDKLARAHHVVSTYEEIEALLIPQ